MEQVEAALMLSTPALISVTTFQDSSKEKYATIMEEVSTPQWKQVHIAIHFLEQE
jgi:hypothetical protein